MTRRRTNLTVVVVLVLVLILPCATQAWLLSSRKQVVTTTTTTTTTSALPAAKSKFSQPAFSQPAHQSHTNNNSDRKKNNYYNNNNNKNNARRLPRSDSKLGEMHSERVKTAGRVGTKRFVDPCKVFVGNLPFDADRSAVQEWICDQMGLPPAVLLNDVKLVTDWKTGRSKGYAFVDFTQAIYGTVCIDKCNNQEFGGRLVSVSQGKKKEQDAELFIKKKKKKAATEEELAIQQGLAEAEDDDDDEASIMTIMDAEEYALIRRLDPDLVESATFDYSVDDDLLEEDEDDDDGIDGFWQGDEDEDEIVEFDEDGFTKPMNREQRREAARRTKRRKLPHKGFGEVPTS